MRLRLNLQMNGTQRILPFNYQYPVSAWIYKTINQGNNEFANFLHNHGFNTGTKSYKFFTFSNLLIPSKGFRVERNAMHLLCDKIGLELSFLVPDAQQHFITGLFYNQHFNIGDKQHQVTFVVNNVEALPLPGFTYKCSFTTMSPVIISRYDETRTHAEYIQPGHPDYERIFFDNLVRKYAAALAAGLIENNVLSNTDYTEFRFRYFGTVRKKGVVIKSGTAMQTQIIGYLYNFELQAPSELIRIGYLAGFGEKNSLGMGCGAVL